MPSQSESGDSTKPLGIRRPVEMPEADVETAQDLAPASGPEFADASASSSALASEEERSAASAPASEAGQSPASASVAERERTQSASVGGETADAGDAGSAAPAEGSGEAAETAASPDEAAEPTAGDKVGEVGEVGEAGDAAGEKDKSGEKDKAAKKEKRSAWLRNVAMAPEAADGATASGDEMPPDRPRKPVLAAVAIGGVVLLAIPILLIGRGSHDGRKERTTTAANRVMTGDGQPVSGAYVPASPSETPSPTPSTSATPKKGAKDGKKVVKAGAAGAAGNHAAKSGGNGGKVSAAGSGGRGPTGPKFSTTTRVLLHNTMTGLCADVPGWGKGSVDTAINQAPCTRSKGDNQLWDLVVNMRGAGPHGADLFTIRNSKDSLCFDVPGNGADDSTTPISEANCAPGKGDNQMWYLEKRYNRHFWIRNYTSHGLCLDVAGYYGSGGKNARLTLFPCDPKDDHIWSFG